MLLLFRCACTPASSKNLQKHTLPFPQACDASKNLGKASDANKNQGNVEAMLKKEYMLI